MTIQGFLYFSVITLSIIIIYDYDIKFAFKNSVYDAS